MSDPYIHNAMSRAMVAAASDVFCEIIGNDDTMQLHITKVQARAIMSRLPVEVVDLGEGSVLITAKS